MSNQIFYFALQSQNLRGEFLPYAVAVTDPALASQLQSDRVWKEITDREYAEICAQRLTAQTLVAHKLKTKTAL